MAVLKGLGAFALLILFLFPMVHAKEQSSIREFYQLTDLEIRNMARSTAVMVDKNKVLSLSDGTVEIQRINPSLNMCALDDFRMQLRIPSPINGGFLVAADLLLTVGHAVKSQEDCSSSYWVFDYVVEKNKEMDGNFIVKESSLYNCVEIINRKFSGCFNDFALIRLDRKVTDRTPLKVRRSGKTANYARLYLMGYPHGLPLKAVVVENVFNDHEESFFTSFSLPGFSGSPVVDTATGFVEGIASCALVNSGSAAMKENNRMLYDDENNCFRYMKNNENPNAGMGIVVRATNINFSTEF